MGNLGLTSRMKSSDEILGIDPPEHQVIQELDADILVEYDNNPFNPYGAEALKELAESIRQNGILHPILVRPLGDRYQILSGRNRFRAAMMIGLQRIPAVIKTVDDDTAAMIVTATNLCQRPKVLHSERARAYKLQMDTLKRQGQRNDLLHIAQKVDVTAQIAEYSKDSKRNVHYYIRLLSLTVSLLNMVDEEKLSFRTAVEISYLKAETQESLYVLICSAKLKISLEQAQRVRKLCNEQDVDDTALRGFFFPTAVNPPTLTNIKVSYKRIQTFFTNNESGKEIEETIVEALRFYRKHHG
jgi:ParB family chromosome partitioning protein